ncbi:MAG: PAS domain-containing protein [Ferrovibrio sp.]|jgi:hypothetical protein|uniref:PAS domain-containing protein n=1 Tax=Ferrovibrio sp. TaxID=1917215 RepID=UPI00391934F7
MGERQPPSETAAALKFRATGAAGDTQPRSPILQRLLAYWQSKCGPDGRLPGRTDLDPLDLRTLLPNIYLIDVLPEGGFRVRLLGEAHVAVYGPGLVGRTIDDIFPPHSAAEFNRLYSAVVRRRTHVINQGQVTWWQSHEWLRYEGLHAPLAADGVRIDCIFGAGAFENFGDDLR